MYIPDNFIVLPHWETRGHQHYNLICHSVTFSWHWATQSLPYHNNAKLQAKKLHLVHKYQFQSHWFESTRVRTHDVEIPSISQKRRLTLHYIRHPVLLFCRTTWYECNYISSEYSTRVMGKKIPIRVKQQNKYWKYTIGHLCRSQNSQCVWTVFIWNGPHLNILFRHTCTQPVHSMQY